ncbi:MAG: hypothetical protein ACK583_14760 [Cyanobacteriota bacterium]
MTPNHSPSAPSPHQPGGAVQRSLQGSVRAARCDLNGPPTVRSLHRPGPVIGSFRPPP